MSDETEQKLLRVEGLLRAFALNLSDLLSIPTTADQLQFSCETLLALLPEEYKTSRREVNDEDREWRQVDRDEFDAFVRSYPSQLQVDVCAIGEPALRSYNDFSAGAVWPESMVAKMLCYDGSKYHGGKRPEYYIPDTSSPSEVNDE